MTAKSNEIWFRTDEIEEFINALEHTALLAASINDNVANWKWLILALHNALQGACTCALRGHDTSGISVLTKESGAAIWHWLDVESRKKVPAPRPPEKLASLSVLYRRIRDTRYLNDLHRLPAHQQMDKDVNKLNSLRNDFSHFVPKGWSLEASGLPRITRHCCDAIEHLAVKFPTYWHHLDEPKPNRIMTALSKIRNEMDVIEGNYARD